MSIKISTLVNKIDFLESKENVAIIMDFCNYMQERCSSENPKVNNLRVVIDYAKYFGNMGIQDVNKRGQILSFLSTKIKDISIDPDKRWRTTWNHYLNRLKLFYRWLYNMHNLSNECHDNDERLPKEWKTPDFIKIKQKQTNRTSPYIENEIWELDELLTIIKYEQYKRNKAAISLMWDMNPRPHEITLLKKKHIRLKENYGEGEIPHQAKTGSGPILLMCSLLMFEIGSMKFLSKMNPMPD